MTPVFRKKRYIAAFCITAVVLLVVLSPFILSSSTALNLALSGINSRIPGTLRVESWIIGWQQGILCQQVVYNGPDNRIRISIPRLTTTQGLLEVVLAPKNLGLVIAEAPVVNVETAPKSTTSVSSAGRRPSLDSDAIPLWNQIRADLQVRDGLFQFEQGEQDRGVGLREVKLDADLQGGVINYELAFRTLREQGSVRASGSLNLPARQHGWLDTLIAETDLAVSGLDIHDFLAFAAEYGSIPSGEGLLSADMHLKTVGLLELQVSGAIDCRDLKLAGGVLGEDTPSFQNVRLVAGDARWSERGWSVSQLDFVGDAARLKGSAEFSGEVKRLEGEGSISLPVLFDQFPHFLQLREAAFIENGRLDFAVELARNDTLEKIKLTAGLDDLGGLYEGRRFEWSAPSSLILNGEIRDRDIMIHALRLEAPFAHIEGRGDLASFVLDATVDLQQLFTETGRFFKTGWDGAGTMELTLKGGARGLDGFRTSMDADLSISNFTLNHQDQLVVPKHQLSLVGSVEAPRNVFWEQRGPLNLEVALSSWIGEIFVVLDGQMYDGPFFKGYFTTDSAFNLDSLTGLLHISKKLPEETSMAGDLQVQAAGYLDREGVEIRDFSGGLDGFVLVRGKDVFEDQDVRLKLRQVYDDKIPSLIIRDLVVSANWDAFFRNGAGLNRFSFADHSLFLHTLDFTSRQTGSIRLDALRIDNWQDPMAGLGCNLEGELNLEKLGGVLQGVDIFPAESGLNGRSRFSFFVDTDAEGGRNGEAEIYLEDVALKRGPEKIWTEKEVLLRGALENSQAGTTQIRKLEIDSEALVLQATGRIGAPGPQQEIELHGELIPDLEKIAAILRSGWNMDIAMAGKQPESFTFEFAGGAAAEERISRIGLDAGLHADRLTFQGVAVEDAALPFTLRDGNLHLDFSGRMEGGEVRAAAAIDFSGQAPVLHVREARQVLQGVQMQKPLVTALLADIYPLFGVLADPAGRFGARLDSLVWPLKDDEKNRAAFVVVFDIRDVKFKAKGLLSDIFGRFGLPAKELDPRDNELYCLARAGRITCSPLSYSAGKEEMTVSGSLGLDGTVDYLLELPVTKKLAGTKRYGVLQGRKIRVAVSGSTERPRFDEAQIDSELDALVRQSAD